MGGVSSPESGALIPPAVGWAGLWGQECRSPSPAFKQTHLGTLRRGAAGKPGPGPAPQTSSVPEPPPVLDLLSCLVHGR